VVSQYLSRLYAASAGSDHPCSSDPRRRAGTYQVLPLLYGTGPLRVLINAAVLACLHLYLAGAPAAGEPLALYGEEIRFDILRKGKTIGSHTVVFRPEGDGVRARSEVNIAFDIFFFAKYRYSYQSETLWRKDRLERLDVEIEENGKRMRLTALQDGGQLTVNGFGGTAATHPATFPTEHWNAEALSSRQVLNTLTGRLNEVAIVPGAHELIDTERGPVRAALYRYTGDLTADVWYDLEGRWVKLRFKGRDGSLVEYICRKCQGPDLNS